MCPQHDAPTIDIADWKGSQQSQKEPRLDAGNKHHDHCKARVWNCSRRCANALCRCAETTKMAKRFARSAHSCRAVGNTMAGIYAGQGPVASTRCLLCLHRQPGDTHLLHDLSADSILVWIHKRWTSVCQQAMELRGVRLTCLGPSSCLRQASTLRAS
jgi:hypothetical protein